MGNTLSQNCSFAQHVRLLHQFHIVGRQKIIRSITRSCVICQRKSSRPQPPMMGQLPMERITPDVVLDKVGIDYAGPIYTALFASRSFSSPTSVCLYPFP